MSSGRTTSQPSSSAARQRPTSAKKETRQPSPRKAPVATPKEVEPKKSEGEKFDWGQYENMDVGDIAGFD